MNIKQFLKLLLPIIIFISGINFLYAQYQYSRRGGGLGDLATYLVIGLIIVVVVFLILREVMCWYWKINERLQIQKEILEAVKDLKIVLSGEEVSEKAPAEDEIPPGMIKCFQCGTLNKKTELTCSNCKSFFKKEFL